MLLLINLKINRYDYKLNTYRHSLYCIYFLEEIIPMAISINYADLALPVSQKLAKFIGGIIIDYENEVALTISFKDLDFQRDNHGYQPIEIRLKNDINGWSFCYIAEFCYLGAGSCTKLSTDVSFNFTKGLYENLFGEYPIRLASEMYQIWESNFINYATVTKVFNVAIVKGV
jgi:hypothetical protein